MRETKMKQKQSKNVTESKQKLCKKPAKQKQKRCKNEAKYGIKMKQINKQALNLNCLLTLPPNHPQFYHFVRDSRLRRFINTLHDFSGRTTIFTKDCGVFSSGAALAQV